MLYCFKKNDSANNITDEICTVCGSDATITIIHNQFKRFRGGNFDLKDEARWDVSIDVKFGFHSYWQRRTL